MYRPIKLHLLFEEIYLSSSSLYSITVSMLCITGMHCTECGYNCHEKCVPHVAKNCTRLRPVSEASSAGSAASNLQSSCATVENASSSPNDETPSTTRGMLRRTRTAIRIGIVDVISIDLWPWMCDFE